MSSPSKRRIGCRSKGGQGPHGTLEDSECVGDNSERQTYQRRIVEPAGAKRPAERVSGLHPGRVGVEQMAVVTCGQRVRRQLQIHLGEQLARVGGVRSFGFPRLSDLSMNECRHAAHDSAHSFAERIAEGAIILNDISTAAEEMNRDLRERLAREQCCKNVLIAVHMRWPLIPRQMLCSSIFGALQHPSPSLQQRQMLPTDTQN